MGAEIWVLVLKTGGMAAVIGIPIAWLFRKGGSISLNVSFGRPAAARMSREGGSKSRSGNRSKRG
jgi:hypothetical protein